MIVLDFLVKLDLTAGLTMIVHLAWERKHCQRSVARKHDTKVLRLKFASTWLNKYKYGALFHTTILQ